MTVGETKTVDITFAEDNEGVEAEMRGKTMTYTLEAKKIEEQELLPLDDDFAKKVSADKLETLDALRADIRKDLLRAERQKARTEVGNEIVTALSDGATLELPAVMIDKQVDSDVENLRNHLGQDHNQTLEAHLRAEDKTLETLREELRPEATRRLRNSLVLREIATREGVSVGPQDIDAEIDRMIGSMENGAQMRQFYQSNYIRTMLENEVFERKLMDQVIDIATEGRGAADPPEEPEDAAHRGRVLRLHDATEAEADTTDEAAAAVEPETVAVEAEAKETKESDQA